jgi:hypothetical protein
MSDADEAEGTRPDGETPTGQAPNGDTPVDERPEQGRARVSPTELAQTELILKTVPDAAAFPEDWRESRDGVQYLYRRGSVIVRDWHLRRVRETLARLVPEDGQTTYDVVAGATRVSWAGTNDDLSVEEVLRLLDEEVGQGVAAPDTLVYVCGHACAAIEQEEVPAGATPVPPPQIGQAAADPRCGHGKGVRVLVMDSGLVADTAADHTWMAGVTGDLEDPVDPRTGRLTQDGGHGTFVAGCLRVTAPEASVHVVNAAAQLPKEEDTGPIGAAFESDLARLVRSQLIAEPGRPPIAVPDILVLNFAGTSRNGGPLLAFAALYDDVIQHLKELLILSPAGNEGDTRKNWPASFSWVVSVGGLGVNWRDRAPWSNHGHNVDVYAPGDRLVNAFATGTYECTWEGAAGELRTFDGMALWSGTSFSTPLVAGLVASRMSTTGQSSRRAWHSLLDLAERQAVPGVGPVLYPGQGCVSGPGCGCGCG